MKKHLIFILFILSSLTGISQSAEKLLERGRNALINKDYVNAINEFTASLQKGESYEAYYSRGISFYSLKDYNKALDDFDSAINIENKGVAYFWKGCTNYQLKKYNEALADLNKATELNYDDSDSLWKMYSYWQLFQFENVILEATKLITNSPTEMAYYFRGYSYRQLNNNNSAKQDANTLIDKFPDSHRGYLLIGYLYFDERKYDLAIQILEIALSKDATKATILHELARAYYYKKEYTKSLTKINEVILIDSNSTYYLFKGRVYYYGLHNTYEANKCFEKVLSIDNNETTGTSAYALLFLGRLDEAIAMQKKLMEGKINAKNYIWLGCFYSLLDREAEAIEYIDKGLEMGYNGHNELLDITDLDNIKFKKSFRDLLAKYNIPYDLDNKTLIQAYVKSAVNNWQRKGTYEKTEDYLARVNEAAREKYIDSITVQAIQYVGRLKVDPTIKKAEFNPDIETFKIYFSDEITTLVKIPITEAKSFNENLNILEVYPVFALTKDENFVIDQISIKNPILNKTYLGSVNATESFSSTQLSLDFAPIETYIDKYKKNDNAQLRPSSVKAKKSILDTNIPLTDKKKEKTFALVIGNEDYSTYQPDLNAEVNVDYAANDAIVFKEYLIKTIGLPSENIFLYTNATAGQMKQAINKMEKLAKAYNGEAELIFFFAGHGLPDENSHESYIMPVDISGSTIQYAIKLSDLYTQLSINPSKRVLVFLDACFSGGARNEALVTLRGVKIKPKENTVNENMFVYASSSGTQSSMGFDEEQHGLFTYFLLKKLNETKGDISLDEMGKYLEIEVNRKAILLKNREQIPQLILNPATDFTLLSKKIND